ncbi:MULTISPECIES: peptidoglycan D,D-transpeptidase FtsI family protein [Rothia]|uniref:Peptidoglycan glycosyltransferase n=1 Tax=Rothia nasimurium TaxID=85336 RepID=A0A1Y1RMV7_9MICC|nr:MULTISPECIES: penicillin-binding protein 2 [Rothia]ORC15923.1 peptidoglycan glycosyltransferase [Rothia nasimurium]
MNKAIRQAWVAAASVFVLLLGSLTYIQFFEAKTLQANAWNSRNLYESYGSQRGSIVVNGVEIASSVESNDGYAFQRTYSQPEQYAGLTGYFSSVYGATGLESAMNEQLSGTSDAQFYDRLTQMFTGGTAAGASVELTVDAELQQLAYNLLDGHKGSIVALNPKTGEVLAMVSTPSYDPNTLSSHKADSVLAQYSALNQDPDHPLYNRAIAGDTYAPGSTFKIIDAVAALESGKYNADSELPNPQNLALPNTNVTLPNYTGGQCSTRTSATLEWALAQSCNTPFAQVAMDLGQDAIARTASNFGYGEDLQIPLSVSQSVFPTNMEDSQLAQAAIGQYDVKTTPLQVAMMSAAIANDGVQMKPNLIRSVKSHNLSSLYEFSAEELRRSTSADVANQVTDWMVNGVDNGIASGAAVSGVKVAGKTGTAEIGDTGLNNSWFTGFAPADDPQIAIAVVYEGVDVTTGAQLAAPAGKELFEAVLNK